MSPPGAWRGWLRRPARAPEPSRSAGGCRSSLWTAAFADSPAPGGVAACAGSAVCRLRPVLAAALLCLPLLAALSFEAAAQSTPTANADGSYTVPSDWALKPSGVAAGGKFRLLFMTSTHRDATSSSIATYNSFVQARAAAGHTAIRDYSAQFRAVGSTATTDARANTSTTGTGVPIYWLNGARIATNYSGFWSATWEHWAVSHRKTESGATDTSSDWHWTGTDADGTKSANPLGHASSVTRGRFWTSAGDTGPISHTTTARTQSHALYALSPVFVVAKHVLSVSLGTSAAAEGDAGATAAYPISAALSPSRSGAQPTVDVCVSGTATLGTDYELLDDSDGTWDFTGNCITGGLQLPRGFADEFRLKPIGDTTVEPDETVIVTIKRRSNTPADVIISPTANTATFTIENDDSSTPTVTVSVDDDDWTEGDSQPEFTFTLDKAVPDHRIRVRYRFEEVTAGGRDFVPAAREGIDVWPIAATETSADFTMALTGDSVDEPDGTATMTIIAHATVTPGGETDYVIGTPSSVTVTMRDNDPTVVSLARTGTGAVTEGGKVEFTVTLGRALVAGEVIDVPLAVSGTGVTTADWSLAPKAGTGLNTGVTLSGQTTTTPNVRFANAGARVATLELTTVADATAEGNGESYTVALGPDGTGANGFDRTTLGTTVGGGADPHATQKSFSVQVNEAVQTPPVVTVTAGTSPVAEGTGASFTVSASPAPASNLTVNLAVADAPNADFVAAANQGSQTVSVSTSGTATWTVATVGGAGETADEPSGPVTVTVATGDGYTVGSAKSASVTVNDDDPTVVSLVRTGTGAVAEGDKVELRVTLGRALVAGETVDVPLAVSGTNVTTADWSLAPKSGTGLNTGVTLTGQTTTTPNVRFAGARARTATLELTAVADGVAESGGESYTVALGPDGTGANGFDRTTLGTDVGGGADPHATQKSFSVQVNDSVSVSWASSRLTVGEGAGVARLALVLSSARSVATTVRIVYGVSGADAHDFRREPSSVTFAAGATRAAVHVPIVDDDLAEDSELFGAAISDSRLPAGVIVAGSPYAFVTIADNETDPVVTITAASDAAVTEGTAARFTLTADRAPVSALAVTLEVADAPGADFVAASAEGARTVTLAKGETSKSFTVATATDKTDEPSGAVTVTVAAGTGYGRHGTPTAQVTVNDDDATMVTLSTPDATATEGDADDTASLVLALGRGLRAGETLSVPLAFSGGAVNTDFTLALSGKPTGVTLSGATVVFTGAATPTATTATVLLTAASDTDAADETVTASLGTLAPTGLDGGAAGTRAGNGRITLADDDEPADPVVTIARGTSPVTEGTAASFTLSASPPPGAALTVKLTVADDASSDFVAAGNEGAKSVVIPTSGTATYTVATVDDTADEANGAVTVTVADGTGYTVGAASSASVAVNDNDATPGLPVLTLTGGPAVTEGTAAAFTVSARPAPAANAHLTVSLTVADAEGADFLAATLVEGENYAWTFGGTRASSTCTTPTVTAGTATATCTIPTVGDNVAEPSGPVTVTLRPRAGAYTVGDPASAEVTVNDDDGGVAATPVVTISAGTSPVAEGTAATYTVRASPKPAANLSVKLTVADAPHADFVAAGDEGSDTVTVSTSGTATYSVATTGGAGETADEPSGPVTVTVATGDGYTVGSAKSASVTVTDDDATALVLSTPDKTATEGDPSDTASLALTLGRALRAGETLTVPLAFSGGTLNTDFTLALSGKPTGVTFSGRTVVFTGAATPTATTATVLLTAATDGNTTDDTVTVSLGTLAATGLGGGVTGSRDGDGRMTLEDASAPVSLRSPNPWASDRTPSGQAGSPEGVTIRFNTGFSRILNAGETVTFPLTLGGTATRGTDYTLRCGDTEGLSCSNLDRGDPSITFKATKRTRIVGLVLLLTLVEDNTDESTETVTLSLGGGSYSQGIVDAPDSVTVSFIKSTFEVRENNPPLQPVMTVTPLSGRDIPLYFTVSGTATEGKTKDWYFDGDPVLGAGQSRPNFNIRTISDGLVEPDETIILTLDTARLPSWVKVGSIGTSTSTIIDPDRRRVSLARTGSGAVREGEKVTFTLTRAGALAAGEAVEVPLEISGTGVTTADWSLVKKAGASLNTGVTLKDTDKSTPKVRFEGAGARVATLELETADDGLDEGGDETYTVAIAPYAYTHATRNRFSVRVREGVVRPRSVTVTPGPAVTEGTDATFTVTAHPAPSSALSVTVTVADAPGSDFVASANEGAQTVTIAAGETSTDFTVPTVGGAGETADEPSGPVTATVTAAGTGYPTGGTGAVTVNDDDPTPVTLTGSADAIVEDGGAKTLTVTLARALVAGERLDVTIVPGGTARSRTDYRMRCGTPAVGCYTIGDPGGQLRFFGGANAPRTATLVVTAIDDAEDEGAGETVTVSLGAFGGNLGGGASGTGSVSFTITDDDDPLPVVTIAPGAAVTEGSDATFTVSADPAPSSALAVSVDVSDAPASDFLAESEEGRKTVTIASGASSATLTVPTVGDDTDEPDGKVRAALAAGTGYRRGAATTAEVTVADDDATVLPTVSIDDATAAEGNPTDRIRFTVRLSAPQPHTVRVFARTRASSPVSARLWDDYLPGAPQSSFRPGETVLYLWVLIVDDSLNENDETFELVLHRAEGAAIGDGVAVGTITNDDPMPAAFLARFGRTVAEAALDGIAGRMEAARTPGMQGTLAGQSLVFDAPAGGEAGSGAGAVSGGDAPGATVAGGTGARALTEVAHAFGGHPANGTPGIGHGFGELQPQSQTMTARDALLGSSFSLTGERDGAGGSMAFWGRAAQGSFDGREGTFSLDGETTTALLGADYARDGWLVGLALAQSEGEGAYRDSKISSRPDAQSCPDGAEGPLCDGAVREGDGEVEASLTAAILYASLRASSGLTLWGAAGHGTGEVTLKTAMGGRYDADISWSMAAAGVRGDLLAPPAEGSGPALALTSDALWARTSSEKTRDLAASDSDVTRLRLGLEGRYRLALESGGELVPKLEAGARHDGGDAETGFGIELGGGLAWSDPALGLTLDLSGRTLLAHEDDDLEDRGFAASLAFDPAPASERGLSLSLRQALGGEAAGGLDALFTPAPLEDRTGGGGAASRWTAEAAYGFPAFGGRFTGSPHVGLGLATGARDYTLGWRWTPARRAPDLTFGLRATRSESDGARPEHAVGFEATARW